MARLTKRYPKKVTIDASGFIENQETIDRELRNFVPAMTAVEKLAEYEDAEEKGLLAHLPRDFKKLCNAMSDYVYVIYSGDIHKLTLLNIYYDDNGELLIEGCDEEVDGIIFQHDYSISEFGKTVFLTPEEAEQALKERESK